MKEKHKIDAEKNQDIINLGVREWNNPLLEYKRALKLRDRWKMHDKLEFWKVPIGLALGAAIVWGYILLK